MSVEFGVCRLKGSLHPFKEQTNHRVILHQTLIAVILIDIGASLAARYLLS
jgi:hypothetical protein